MIGNYAFMLLLRTIDVDDIDMWRAVVESMKDEIVLLILRGRDDVVRVVAFRQFRNLFND